MTETLDLRRRYVELRDGGAGAALDVTERFWPDLMSGRRQIEGRLVMASDVTEDAGHWERHPAGEELVVLLAGAVDFILDEPDGERTVALRESGEAVLVPPGIWHRFAVRQPGRLLFVTPGEGTTHRPV